MAAADPQTQETNHAADVAPASSTQHVEDMGYAKVEGPVMTMMSKRLRALRKKQNRIQQIEEGRAAGKPVNKEQEEMLKSKTTVALLIEEYERLKQPLLTAVKEEVTECEKGLMMAMRRRSSEAGEEGSGGSGATADGTSQEREGDDVKSKSVVDSERAEREGATGEEAGDAGTVTLAAEEIGTLVQLLYLAALFDLRDPADAQLVRRRNEHERRSCLSYDPVTDDDVAAGEGSALLSDRDLNAIAALGKMLTSRVTGSFAANHQEAVSLCVSHAHKLLAKSTDIIDSTLGISYDQLRERLNRILASRFFTAATADRQAAEAAMAAASGHAAQVPGQTSSGQHLSQGEGSDQQLVGGIGPESDAGGAPVSAEAASQQLQRLLLGQQSAAEAKDEEQGQTQHSQGNVSDGVASVAMPQSGVEAQLVLPFAPEGGFLLDLQNLPPEALLHPGDGVQQAAPDGMQYSQAPFPTESAVSQGATSGNGEAMQLQALQTQAATQQHTEALFAADTGVAPGSLLPNGEVGHSYLQQVSAPGQAEFQGQTVALGTGPQDPLAAPQQLPQSQAYLQPGFVPVHRAPNAGFVQQKGTQGGGYGRRGEGRGGRGGYRGGGGRGGRGGPAVGGGRHGGGPYGGYAGAAAVAAAGPGGVVGPAAATANAPGTFVQAAGTQAAHGGRPAGAAAGGGGGRAPGGPRGGGSRHRGGGGGRGARGNGGPGRFAGGNPQGAAPDAGEGFAGGGGEGVSPA